MERIRGTSVRDREGPEHPPWGGVGGVSGPEGRAGAQQPAVTSPARRQQSEGGGRSASSPPGARAATQGEEDASPSPR